MTIGARKHRFHGPGAADVNRRALKAGSVFDSFLAYLGWLIANVLAGICGERIKVSSGGREGIFRSPRRHIVIR